MRFQHPWFMALAVIVLAMAVIGYTRLSTSETKNGTAVPESKAVVTVAAGRETVTQKITEVLGGGKEVLPAKFKPFHLVAANDPLFPTDDHLRHAIERDQALAAYANLAPEKRTHDFYF